MEATKQPPPDDEGPRSRPKHRGRRLMRTQSKEETLMAQTAAVKQSKANARAQKQLGHNTWRKAFMQHYWLYIMMLPGAALHDHLQLPADDGPVYGIYRFQPLQR